ncbi:MAG: xanthine dehydrogenase family protein molybdopterin-binding subunit [Bacillota bacterium]
MKPLSTVGYRIIRVDGEAKVTGKAIYPQDIYMEGMLYGKTVRSTKVHALIKIDIGEAEKLNGVIKVLTHRDVTGHNSHGVLFKDHEVFCSERVRRIGDPIAFIIAESEKIAQKAADLVKIEYTEIPAVFDPVEAMNANAPKVHGDTNIIYHYKCRTGDVETAFQQCAVVVEREYKTSMVDHAFLQPEAGVAYMEDDIIHVSAATQYPHFDQIEVAEALGLDLEKVRIINPAVGGAFGGREDITLQIHLALGACLLKKPIKAVFSREESFYAHSKRHPISIHIKTGADARGKLMALEATLIGDTGAYASWAINVMRKAGVHITGPYEIPNVKVDSYAVYTNNPFCGAMRGFGATQVPVATEQQMDIIAEELGMSPIEIRMKNCFKVGSVTANGQLLEESVPLDRCIEAVKERLFREEKSISGKKRGKGIASTFYGTGYGNGFPDVSKAVAELNQDGQISIYVGATEVGQGAKTIMSQIAAEVLGVSVKDIRFVCEDTALTPDAGTAAASRQTYNTGNAIKKAAESLKSVLIDKAQKHLQLNSSWGLEVKDQWIFLKILPEKRVHFRELIKDETIRVEEAFIAQTVKMDDETGQGAPYWPYTFTCYGVEVEVDTETGVIELVNGVCAQDVGRAVNPEMIEGQIDGGFAMGYGYAIMEDIQLVKGDMKNHRFTNYLIPTAMDMPDLERIIIEDPSSCGPFGAKGIGEPVMVAAAPAILNAIYDAIGIRFYEIPVTPDKVLAALKARG